MVENELQRKLVSQSLPSEVILLPSATTVMFSQASVILSGGGGRPPLQETATAADGTHPTGMHSCLDFKTVFFIYLSHINLS